MSVFRISTKVAIDIAGTGGLTATNNAGLRRAGGLLKIMKGTIPTQSQIDNADSVFRDVDVLTSFTSSTITGASNGNLTWNQQMVTATATGTAAWFYWHGVTNIATYKTIVVGTITIPGGGGDMSLTDLNIISGQTYALGPATFAIPREYNF